MLNYKKIVVVIITLSFLMNLGYTIKVEACKDILACGTATKGNYNLLLKVRDPSRPGLQTLTIVPSGYEYAYNHPWRDKTLFFTTEHKYIGVATKGDVIPDIVKPGMMINDKGIAFGDADSGSSWVNPAKNAWDDFDWMRYSCEKADDEKEAVDLLTKEVVDSLHAPGVSENLFVVGPREGYVIEADAYRYNVNKITNNVVVMSNYPKTLWRTQIIRKLPVAWSFDIVLEKYLSKNKVARLKSSYGIKIVDVEKTWIDVKTVPLLHSLKTRSVGKITRIYLGERKNVGEFSVKLEDIKRNKAKIYMCYKFKAWEDKMMEFIRKRIGEITVEDMMNWSRLDREDMDGLRPMCEDLYDYESAVIYKIPEKNYEVFSMGWFAPNHACSSIYVPFHICNKEIYDPYETGEAAQMCLDLSQRYDHDNLTSRIIKIEKVFLHENNNIENRASRLTKIRESIININDVSLQKLAFLTEKLWMEISWLKNLNDKKDVSRIIDGLWEENFSVSLDNMKKAIVELLKTPRTEPIIEKIWELGDEMCRSRLEIAKLIQKPLGGLEKQLKEAEAFAENKEYEKSMDLLRNVLKPCNDLIFKQKSIVFEKEKKEKSYDIPFLPVFIILFLITTPLIYINKRR